MLFCLSIRPVFCEDVLDSSLPNQGADTGLSIDDFLGKVDSSDGLEASKDVGSQSILAMPTSTEPSSAQSDPLGSLSTDENFFSPAPTAPRPTLNKSFEQEEVAKFSINWDMTSQSSSQEAFSLFNTTETLDSSKSLGSSKELLTLFAERKKEPLQINPLGSEEPTSLQREGAEMSWGWSLGIGQPRETKKKGWLEW